MKDKTRGDLIEEFVRLKAKIYSFLVDNKIEHKKAKGEDQLLVIRVNYEKQLS